MSLNVLLISLDSTLAIDEDNVSGNAKARHIEYAHYLSNSYIVVKTCRSIKRKVKKIKDNLFVYPTSSLNKYFFLFDAYKLASKICKENKIHLISTQDPFITGFIGWLLKKKYDIPLNIQIAIDMIHNEYFIKEGIFNFFFNELGKWIIKKADTIRVSTMKEKENLVSLGITKEKIHYVPFFIDFSLFQQKDDNKIRDLHLNGRFTKIVLSVNRLVKQKNLDLLIRSMPSVIKKYPRCLFLILGSGPQEYRLKRIALKLGIAENIRFQGAVPYKDMPLYFQAADIFVSTAYYEGTCMAIEEAAAAKKPIISTPHAVAAEVIRDGYTGYSVAFGDHISLAKKILYLLENEGIAKDMGNQAYLFISQYYKKEEILQRYSAMCEDTAWG